MRILISGFEPFLDEAVNPTQLIANHVNSCDWHANPQTETLDVRGIVLPVLFGEAFERLERERQHFQPDIVLSFGLAGGRDAIELEQVAINVRGGNQTARGDNGGRIFNGEIEPGVAFSLPTTLPSDRLIQALEDQGVPAGKSYSAGTYVCNDLFFLTQNRLRLTRVTSGFIHVPRMTEDQGAWPWSRFELAVSTLLTELAK